MKKICCTFLLLSALRLHGMANEQLPGKIGKMCNGVTKGMPGYHCDSLRTFFYLTRIMSSPEKTAAIEEYSRAVPGFKPEEGLPAKWALVHDIVGLCKTLNKDPQETGSCILEAEQALLQLAGKTKLP